MAIGLGRSAGPLRGLQSLGGRSGGINATSPMQRSGQQVNQNIQNRTNAANRGFLNSQGGMTYGVGPGPQAVGTNGMGQNIYGWVNGQPVLNPTQNYVQFGPGEGPGIPRPRATSTGPSGPTGPTQEMGGLIGPIPELPPVADIGPIDDEAAVRAAYGRAKDTAGQQGRAAMNALMEVQGARGIVGSGLGVNEAGGLISETARQLGDVNREQAIQRVENERARQFANYQGRINQRGQNLGQRGQELERRRYNAGNSPRGTTVY